MLARSPNTIVSVQANSGVRVLSDWKNDPELALFAQQSQAKQTSGRGAPPRIVAAQKMPAGPAPRIATAGTLSGRVIRYSPPAVSFAHGDGGHFGSGAPGSPASPASSASASSSAARGASTSAGSSSSGGRVKP